MSAAGVGGVVRELSVEKLVAEALRGLDALSLRQILVMLAVVEGGRPLNELGLEVGITSAAMTGLVDKLEVRGLVTRERLEMDRRRIFVVLTGRGVLRVMQIVGEKEVSR